MNKFKNKTTYDPIADAVYIYGQKAEIARTVRINDRVNLDLGKKGEIVGIEILDATYLLADAKRLNRILVDGMFHKVKKTHK
jgi:uncharacterized protein YuzE